MSDSIAPETIIWRYMDFTKFVSLFMEQSLYFCRVDQLGDPFEGNISRIEYESVMRYEGPEWDAIRDKLRRIYREIRETYFVNCWHANENESAAMWSLYSGQYNGVAIRTDFQSLKDSIGIDQFVSFDKVGYRDYKVLPFEHEMKLPHLSKQIEFQHENEIRAYMGGVDPDQMGISVPVDLCALVKDVVVAPYAEQWFVELVKAIVLMAESQANVYQSQLANAPDF